MLEYWNAIQGHVSLLDSTLATLCVRHLLFLTLLLPYVKRNSMTLQAVKWKIQ